MSDNKNRGLYDKFSVKRTDGRDDPGEKHDDCRYFVLDLTHDPLAIPAARAYALSAWIAGYRQLSEDLTELVYDSNSRAMSPAEVLAAIPDQRARKWPDFHPEDYCHRCGRPNPSWWVESDLWNIATASLDDGRYMILCPSCFVELYEQETGKQLGSWEMRPEEQT